MSLNKTVLAIVVIMTFLSACSSTDEKKESILDGTQNDASTRGLTDGGPLSGEQFGTNTDGMALSGEQFGNQSGNSRLGPEFSDPSNPLSKSIIYFMYDSSQVQQEFIPVVAAHAQYLKDHPTQQAVLEGHADERGSPEYNIALGEQRAKSVFRMMTVQGVSRSQLDIVSYGEEKPLAFGMDNSSWQLNRRVEISYQVQ